MRIGYLVDLHGAPYDQPLPDRENVVATQEAMIEECLVAERAGFHGIQVPDRHGRTETYFPGPLQLMTILARETERVAIGSYTLVHTLYHPMLVAEQTAVIDTLSHGRAYQTLARGYHRGYWDYFGIEHEHMLGRFLEGVEVMRLAFEGERFTYEGEHFRVIDSLLTPQPYQEHVPIWGGASYPKAVRRCGRWADSWTSDPFPIDPPTWHEQVGAYREEAERHGKKPFVVLMRDGWVADTFEDAARDFGTPWVEEMRFYWRNRGGFARFPEIDSEDKIVPSREHLVIGTAQDCIERLERYEQELGVDYVTMRFRMPVGPPLEVAREQIQRFGEEVVSYFHRKDPPIDHPAIPEGARW